jgi:hypothetical protein
MIGHPVDAAASSRTRPFLPSSHQRAAAETSASFGSDVSSDRLALYTTWSLSIRPYASSIMQAWLRLGASTRSARDSPCRLIAWCHRQSTGTASPLTPANQVTTQECDMTITGSSVSISAACEGRLRCSRSTASARASSAICGPTQASSSAYFTIQSSGASSQRKCPRSAASLRWPSDGCGPSPTNKNLKPWGRRLAARSIA